MSARAAARWGVAMVMLALLAPLTGILAPVGPWRWEPATAVAAARASFGLTALAMLVVVLLGTPLALYLRGCSRGERALWQALLLLSVVVPPLALGLLLSLLLGPTALGAALRRAGVATANSAAIFVLTQTYVAMGYYVLGASAAFASVPRALETQARLLGDAPWRAFARVTLPLAGAGLAVSLALAWVRAVGEFGAVAVTAYYPAGIPVQLWIDLQDGGFPTVMPLLTAFLATALPLPWLVVVLLQHRLRE